MELLGDAVYGGMGVPEDGPPQFLRVFRGRGLGRQVLIDGTDVGAALAASYGCLVRAELWFHRRAKVAGDGCPEQPPEAAGEL